MNARNNKEGEEKKHEKVYWKAKEKHIQENLLNESERERRNKCWKTEQALIEIVVEWFLRGCKKFQRNFSSNLYFSLVYCSLVLPLLGVTLVTNALGKPLAIKICFRLNYFCSFTSLVKHCAIQLVACVQDQIRNVMYANKWKGDSKSNVKVLKGFAYMKFQHSTLQEFSWNVFVCLGQTSSMCCIKLKGTSVVLWLQLAWHKVN